MADERRNNRSGQGRPGAGPPAAGGKGRPAAKKPGPGGRAGRPADSDRKPYGRREEARDTKPGERDRKSSPKRDDRGPRRERPSSEARSADQRAYDGPDLPEWITGQELDRAVTAQLRGLPEKLAARVGRHLAAAQHFLEVDNAEIAYQHALAAKSRAQRLAIVREAVGETAYYAGHFEAALAELRAAKRMNGATAYLPMMADCHRALGHAEQALKLAQSPSVKNMPPALKGEMTIIAAGARADLGQFDAALRILEQAPLMSQSREEWVVRLRYAYADILEQAGRTTDALAWFHRTFAIDSAEATDAGERAAALEATRSED